MERPASPQIITVHGKIHIGPFESLKEFFYRELPKLFFQYFGPDFPGQIESTSSMLVKGSRFRFLLKLNTNWIEFRLPDAISMEEKVCFVPHPDGDANIRRLCRFLNQVQPLLELPPAFTLNS